MYEYNYGESALVIIRQIVYSLNVIYIYGIQG